MRVFKCLITDDEMFNDSYDYEEKDGFYVVKGRYETRRGDNVVLAGSNPSAEEGGDDDDEPNTESGVDIIMDQRLKETGFGTKKDYTVYMKEYMKSIFAKLTEQGKKSTDEIAELKAGATEAFKKALGKFKDLQFFTGVNMDPDGLVVLMEWVEADKEGQTVQTPYLYFYKAGLVDIKY